MHERGDPGLAHDRILRETAIIRSIRSPASPLAVGLAAALRPCDQRQDARHDGKHEWATGFAYPVARSMTVPIVHITAKPARIQATGRQLNGRLGARGCDRECGASGLWSDASNESVCRCCAPSTCCGTGRGIPSSPGRWPCRLCHCWEPGVTGPPPEGSMNVMGHRLPVALASPYRWVHRQPRRSAAPIGQVRARGVSRR